MTVQEKIKEFAPMAEKMPGVVVIHEIDSFSPKFMTSNGLELLGISLEELIEVGEDYQKKFLNQDFMEDYLKALRKMLQEDALEETYTIFHQVQLKEEDDYVWYASSLKVFHVDEKNRPTHIVTTAFPIGGLQHLPQKAERLLAENFFHKKNYKKFSCLSIRAKQILRLVALGKSSGEISALLNISVDTVNSHRMAIKQKLEISTQYEFTKYALSFDLI